MSVFLETKGISKSFSGFYANKNVNISISKGEIHTILGENGAGKSTFVNIISGLYLQDSGEIFINGIKQSITSPQDSLKLKIGVIHQHSMLVNNLSAMENILLTSHGGGIVTDSNRLRRDVQSIVEKFGISIDLDEPVWKLSISQKQWVEIIKLMLEDFELFILDEPTAVLTPQETEFLFFFLNRLKTENKAIIYISHKMKEVMELSDKVTIFKKGETVCTLVRGDFDEQKLAELMVGDAVSGEISKTFKSFDKKVLLMENVNVKNDKGLSDLRDFCLELYEGEILGIAGITGNGQKALAETLTGIKYPHSGKIILNDEDITYSKSKSKYIAGVAHIPEDRKSMGISPDMNIGENLILKNYFSKKFRKGFFLDYKKVRDYGREMINKYSISTASEELPVRLLSGGNIQKVIIARELSENPLILVALYPTRGLDVGSADYVHRVISASREKGMSTLLISEDLDELLKLSDRVAVLFRGKNMGYLDPQKTSKTEIGLLMSGKNEN